MKIRIRENIAVIIVFGMIFFWGVSYLHEYLNEIGHYQYYDDNAKEVLESFRFDIKTPNYDKYELSGFEQGRKKYNKNDFGIITITYKNEDKYFCYFAEKLTDVCPENYPGAYRVINGGHTMEIPYDKIELSNTTIYYISRDKYDSSLEIENIYVWIIDDIYYKTNADNNVEHEDVIKLIESMN